MPRVRRVISIEDRVVDPPRRQGPLRIEDCDFQPLNFLAGLPVLVPKDRAWPGLREKPKTQRVVTVQEEPVDSDEYDSDSAYDDDSDGASADDEESSSEEDDEEKPGEASGSSSGDDSAWTDSWSSSSEDRSEDSDEEYEEFEALSRQGSRSTLQIQDHDGGITFCFEQQNPPRREKAVYMLEPKTKSKAKTKAKAKTKSKSKSKSSITPSSKPGKVVCLKKLEKMAKARREEAARVSDTDTGFDGDTSSEDDLPKKQPSNRAKRAAKHRHASTGTSSDPSDTPGQRAKLAAKLAAKSKAKSRGKPRRVSTSSSSDPFATPDEDADEGTATAGETTTDEGTTTAGETTTDEAVQTEGETTTDEAVQTEGETINDEATPAKQNGRAQPAEPAADNDNNMGPSVAPVPNRHDFTASEDAIIVAMKEGGETWAAIGQALHRGKKEVQHRWRELQLEKQHPGGTGAPAPETPAEENNMQTDSASQADNELSSGREPQRPGRKAQSPHDAKKKARNPPGGAGYRRAATARPAAARHPRGFEPPAPESYYDTCSDAGRSELYTAMYGRLYTDALEEDEEAAGTRGRRRRGAADRDGKKSRWWRMFRLRPDSNFDERDCRLLHAIDSERRVRHWLEVQAAFYNATGRMVDAGLLRRKVEEGQGGGGEAW